MVLVAVIAGALALITIAQLERILGFLFDFKGDLYQAGQAILHGQDPYRPHYLATLAAISRAGGKVSPAFALPVYPAPSLLAAIPFALLPYLPAGLLFLVLMVAAMVCGLRLLGVRDWRCIALALVSWPFVFGLDVGALGPVLVLVWLLVTRRLRTLALTLAIGTAALLGAWAVIGFAGFTEYPRMLANLAFLERGAGVSVVSALMVAGVPGGPAEIAALALATGILGLSYRSARGGNDGRALGLTVIAALVASPIVWPHYFVLLFVPIALASPRLSVIWFAPLFTVLVATPTSLIKVLVWVAVLAAVAVYVYRSDGTQDLAPSANYAPGVFSGAVG
jgi:alpha-1,2-mannosyltransferase